MFPGVFGLFKTGISPCSSHTVGPVEPGRRFAAEALRAAGGFDRSARSAEKYKETSTGGLAVNVPAC
jgi:hypothetical protein